MIFNSFVGPSPLGGQQAIYGRDREIRELFYLLTAERIVWLHSPSGAGKTSLVQSGLIPRLLQDNFRILPTIRVGWQPPTDLPQANRFVFSMLISLEEYRKQEQRRPLEELACLSMTDYLRTLGQEDGDAKCSMLLFDQFEEVLTIDPLAHTARQDFFEQLGRLLEDRRLWALFSIREDYLAPLASYAEVLPTRMSHLFRLDLLNCKAAHQVIVATARDGGRRFADDAATKLVGDLAGIEGRWLVERPEDETARHVEPVQLQVVCRSLWERVDAEQEHIELEDLQKIGNVDRALQDYYAERVTQVAQSTTVDERQMRDWFDRQLITEAGLRGQVLRGAKSCEGLPNKALLPLVDAHLIRKERRRGLVWIELAHDRLVAPVRSDNARWRRENLSLLARCTEAWQQAGRPTDKPRLLLLGEELEAVEQWLDETENQATADEQVYLQICRASQAAERNRRKLRWVGAMISVVIAVSGCVFWNQKLEVGRKIAREHEEAAGVAFREGVFAVSWEKTLEALTEGDERLPTSLGRLLHPKLQPSSVRAEGLSLRGLRLSKGSQFHGLWLAKNRVFTVSARHVIDRFLYRLWWLDLGQDPKSARLPISLDEARSFAWNAHSRRLAVGDWRGEVTLLQLEENSWVKRQRMRVHGCCAPQGCDVLSLSFDDTGRWLAAGDTRDITLWDLSGDDPRMEGASLKHCILRDEGNEHSRQGSRVMGLAFHPSDERLAVGLEDGRVFLHSLGGECFEAPDLEIGQISVLRYHPDGGWLVAGGGKARSSAGDSSAGRHSLVLWHPESGEIVRPREKGKESDDPSMFRVASLAFHPERADILASGLDNGEVLLWRRVPAAMESWDRWGASLELLARIDAHRGAVMGLSFRGDGRELISVSSDGSLQRIPLRLKLGAQGAGVEGGADQTGEERDAINVLIEPGEHQKVLRDLLPNKEGSAASESTSQAVTSKAAQLDEVEPEEVLDDSDAWSWSENGQFEIDVEKSESSRSAGTIQKASDGKSWLVFVDHRQVSELSLAEAAQRIRESMTVDKSGCLDRTRGVDADTGGAVLRRWCDLPQWDANESTMSGEYMGRRVTFRRVTLNGQRGFIEVQPRKEVRIEFDWQMELMDPTAMVDPTTSKGLCPGCQIQLYYGLADPSVDNRYKSAGSGQGFSKCLANAVMGPGYRGDSGSRVHSFQAPDRPGIYYVTWRFGFDYICNEEAEKHFPDISQALAAVRVLGDYKPEPVGAKVLSSFTELQTVPSVSPPGALNRVVVDSRSQHIAITSFDKRARVWTADGRFLTWISDPACGSQGKGHTGRLTDIAWNPKGDHLLTTSVDGYACLWSIEGESVATLQHEDRVLSGVFSPDGMKILTASRDTRAILWTLTGDREVSFEGHRADVVSAVFNPAGDRILTASRDRTARIWDLQGHEIVSLKHHGWLRAAIFSPRGSYVATASEDKRVRVWDLSGITAERPSPHLQGSHEDAVSDLAFSPDEQLLATASLDGKAHLWSMSDDGSTTEDAQPVAVLQGHGDGIVDLAFSPEGRWLATASHDKTVRIWDIGKDGAAVRRKPEASYVLEGHQGSVLAVRFIDNDRLVTASFDGTAKIWKLDPDQEGVPDGD